MTSIFVRRAVGALAIVSCSLLTSSAVAHADDDEEVTVLPPIVVTASPDEGGGGPGGFGLPGGGGGAGQPPQQIEPIVVISTPMTAAEKAELNAAVKNESWQGAIAVLTSRGFTVLRRLGAPPNQVALLQRADPLTNITLTCVPSGCSVADS